MKLLAGLILALAVVILAAISAHARVPPQIYCWTPDSEFPVECGEEEEDEFRR